MAGRHEVTCIVPDGSDPDRRIDKIGGKSGGEGTGGAWTLALDRAIEGIENGKWSFWTQGGGRATNVIVAKRANGKKYLKTEADEVEPNNLLAMPKCPA